MDWTQVLTIIASNVGVVLALFLWTNSKIDKVDEKLSERTREIVKEIRDSNLDFHGRLSRIEGHGGRK